MKLLPRICFRSDGVIPMGTCFGSCDVEFLHFWITDFDLRGVAVAVELCGDFQTAGVGCSANRIQHHFEATQRLSCPIDRDWTKQSMFHVVPLRGAARVGETLGSGNFGVKTLAKLWGHKTFKTLGSGRKTSRLISDFGLMV